MTAFFVWETIRHIDSCCNVVLHVWDKYNRKQGRTIMKKLISIIICLVLTVGMIAVPVNAEGTTPMYVVVDTSGITYGAGHFSYNKDGFVAKRSFGYGTLITVYKYSKGRLKSLKTTAKSSRPKKSMTTFQYNKKGQVIGTLEKGKIRGIKDDAMESFTEVGTLSYDSKNRLIKDIKVNTLPKGSKEKTTYKFVYGDSGYPISSNYKNGSISEKNTFEYDEHGNVFGWTVDGYREEAKFTYDENGNVISVNWFDNGELTGEGTFTYELIQVPNKYVAAVKKQQWDIINFMVYENF